MNIDQLRYFLSVAEHGSVNSVADTFFMTPQAINASLRKLEAEFDSPLLSRSKKGITLTPQGQMFNEWAKTIVNQYEKMQLILTAYNNENSALSGSLSVFSASIFTETFLPSMIHDFTQIFPNTNIKILTVSINDALPHFFKGYCDVVFLTAGKNYLENTLRTYGNDKMRLLALMQDRLVICAQPNHPLMKYTSISAELLTEYIPKTKTSISFFHTLATDGNGKLYPQAVSDSTSAELHKQLMRDNNVVTCMPKLAYQQKFQADGFASVPMGEEDTTVHAILYRDDDTLEENELIRQFVRTLQHRFATRYGSYQEKPTHTKP